MALQVIGAGFGRTGTLSMKTALEQIGLGPCYHMAECMPKGPAHWQLWRDAAAGNAEWDRIFDGFESCVDFPVSFFYRELAEHYPDAKVVLTVRDPERWYESTQETIFERRWMEWLRGEELGRFIKATINDFFQDRMHDRDHLIRRFNEHVEEVRSAIPAERLLVFEVKDGWGPLCEFLGVPARDGVFPHVNDTEATKAILGRIVAEGPEAVLGYMGETG